MKEISLTQGKVALVDDDGYEWLNQWKWCFSKGYAIREKQLAGGISVTIFMHRQILGLSKKDVFESDHVNGDSLNNRRCNLRACTRSENNQNRNINKGNVSGFKGVRWRSDVNKWQSRIGSNGKQKHLGYFTSPEIAHEAYCKAAIELHGEFANFGHGCAILKGNDVSR